MNTLPFHPNPVVLVWQKDTLRTFHLEQQQSWLVGDQTAHISLARLRPGSRWGAFRQVEGEWFFVDESAPATVTLLNGRRLPRPLRGIRQPVPLNHGTVLRAMQDGETTAVMLFLCAEAPQEWVCRPLSRAAVTPLPPSAPAEDAPASITYLNGRFYLTAGQDAGNLCFNRGRLPESVMLRDGDCLSWEGISMYFAEGLLFCCRSIGS